MKNKHMTILAVALLGAAGCAAPSRVATLKGVGPAPTLTSPNSSEGFLQVHTARERAPLNINGQEFAWNNDFGRNDFLFGAAHTDYTIYAEDGRLLQEVRNAASSDDANPALVTLSPGHYRIRAEAVDFNDVTTTVMVPVCVQPGMTTSVHLDGSWNPSNPLNDNDVVRLSNGSFVGYHCPSSQEGTYALNASR